MGRITGLLAVFALGLLLPSAAQASFPGENGKIAFERSGDIWTMNPDGSGQVNLTNDAISQTRPAWSPEGARIAFQQGSPSGISIMDANGANRSALPVPGGSTSPTWSPDGQHLAYLAPYFDENEGDTEGVITTIKADGSPGTVSFNTGAFSEPGTPTDWSPRGDEIALMVLGLGEIAEGYVRVANASTYQDLTQLVSFVRAVSWAPNRSRVVYAIYGSSEEYRTVAPDGTDDQLLLSMASGTPQGAAWSPDGQKIALGGTTGLHTINPDGSGLSASLGSGNWPDWQPILRGYARAKAATPMSTPLVPAYTPCASPNRVHAAPLSYNSCNPPSQTSGFATVGSPDANGAPAKSVGSLKLVAIGEVPINTGNGNQSDLVIDFDITDVRNKTGLADYSGGLRAKTALQITDRNNTPYPGGPGPGTVAPTTFEFNVPCATTPSDATIGSTCAASTTANAVLPGQVLERQRAIWELGRIEVQDGGTDGNPSTGGDNTVFATQGVFIP